MHSPNRWIYLLGLISLLLVGALPAHAAPPPSLPPDLKGQDLGTPDIPGSFTTDATKGTITVVAGGSDIWGTADEGFFVFKENTGDGSVTMRFTSRTGGHTDNAAKSGPMIRATTDQDAVSAFLPFHVKQGYLRKVSEELAAFPDEPELGSVPSLVPSSVAKSSA